MSETSVYGIRIAYSSTGQGSPILLLHDLAGARSQWAGVVKKLTSKARYLAVDLPGFGGSGRPHVLYSPLFAAEVMEGFCDKQKLKTVHVIGYGYGAAVALELASLKPCLVQSLALVNPPPILPTAEREASINSSADLACEEGAKAGISDFMNKHIYCDKDRRAGTTKDYAADFDKTNRHVVHTALQALASWEGKRALMGLEHPTAILQGQITDIETALVERLCPHALHGQILGGTRLSVLQECEQVAAALNSFLERALD